MTQLFLKKLCPTCKTAIGLGLFSSRDEILRCPNCNELLIENPKRKQIGIVINLLGLLLGIGCSYLLGISLLWGFMIIVFSFMLSLAISNLTIIKKELVIRNKETNEISYIDRTDWREISMNSSEKKNNLEIIEELDNTLPPKEAEK